MKKLYITYDARGRAYYFKSLFGLVCAYLIGKKEKTFLDIHERDYVRTVKDFRRVENQ